MRKLLSLVLLLIAAAMSAQPKPKAPAVAPPDAAWMQQVWDAWNTLDPANAARFYDKSPNDIFFDITPLEYKGWTQYEVGTKPVLAGFQSLNCKVAQPEIHSLGRWAWGTSLVNCDAVMKDGTKSPMHLRYTGVFQNRTGEWLIVHEHISAPLPQEVGGGARMPRKPKKM